MSTNLINQPLVASANDKIVAKELRFAVHIPARNGHADYHMVKYQNHHESGLVTPSIELLKNVKRPYYVTVPQRRTHKQKKETEKIENLSKYMCTQSELRGHVAAALDMHWSRDSLKKLSDSPYLYGTEISSTSLLKGANLRKNTTHRTPYSVAFFDTETDVLSTKGDDGDIIITTVVFKNMVFTGVVKSFVDGIANVEEQLAAKSQKYIGEYIKKNNYQLITYVAEDTIDLIRETFKFIHGLKPDFLAIWNMDFDIPKILAACKKYDVNPADLLCDPSIPKHLRLCEYKEGLRIRTKANGKDQGIDWVDQWHSLTLTASFYVIDAACTYRLLRLAKPKSDVGYGLDAILDKELGIRKLSFTVADKYKKRKKHEFMQMNYKLEYMVYAQFDVISMQELNEKTTDLHIQVPGFAGCTDFAKFNSKPRAIGDALHYYARDRGLIMNSIPDEDFVGFETLGIEDEEENETDLDGWIMALHPHMTVLGMKLIKENPLLRTYLRGFVYDSDATSAYPTATSILNVSKATTKRRLIAISDVQEDVMRLQGINTVTGYVNSIEFCTKVHNFPRLDALKSDFLAYRQERASNSVVIDVPCSRV